MSQELKDRALALKPEDRALLVEALKTGKGFTGALRGLSPLKSLPAEELAELKDALAAPDVEKVETPVTEPVEKPVKDGETDDLDGEPVKDGETDELKEALTDVKKSAREMFGALARLGRAASEKTSNHLNRPDSLETVESKEDDLDASEKLNSLKEKSVDSWKKFLDFSEKKIEELENKCKSECQYEKSGSCCESGCCCKKNENRYW